MKIYFLEFHPKISTSQMKLLNKSLLLLFFMLAWGTNVWAQPSQITPVSDEKCAGMIRFNFLAGQEISGTFNDIERNIDNSKLMIQFDGEEAKELMFFDAENCSGQIFSLELEGVDVTLDGCERERPYDIKLKNARTRISGNDRLVEMELHGLGPIRSQKGFDIWLEYKWYEDNEDLLESDETAKKRYEKHNYINAILTTAFRDECNPTEIKVTANAKIACNESGFKYRVTIQKSTNADLSSPTTLVDNKSYNAGSAGSSIITNITDITAGQVYYRSTIDYLDGDNVVYQTEESVITPVQEFNVAPPTMSAVSNDGCDNKINVKWQYNASEANRFNIYRSSDSDTYLQFDGSGDFIEVLHSTNISPATTEEMTIEAWVRVDKTGSSQTIIQNGSFFLFMNDGKLKGYAEDYDIMADGGDLPLNSWVHVALSMAWSGSKSFTKLFINGVEKGSISNSGTPSFSKTVKIGIPDPYPNPVGFLEFEGGLNNVRIWSTAFETIDPNRTVTGTESDLVMFFDFEEGLPNQENTGIGTVQDKSSNNYQGQMNGFDLTGLTSNFNATFLNHQKIAEVDGQTFAYEDDENINFNEVYEYYITAIKTCASNTEESLPSNSIAGFSPTIPFAPTDLTIAVNKTANTITLDWTDNASNETRYVIERRFGDSKSVFYAQPNDTIYIDDAIVACRTYEYDVFAENVCGKSSLSAQGSTRLEPSLDNALAASAVAASKGEFTNRVELSWTPQNNTSSIIDRFRIYRKPLGAVDSTQVDVVSGSANIYRDATADAGVLYEYTLIGEVDCDGDVLKTNTINTVGFRTATGLVSGQVTFSGGNAVEGAKILVAPSDGNQTGRSIQLDGIDDKILLDTFPLQNSSFTIEFWAKRSNANTATLVAHGSNITLSNQNLTIGFTADGYFNFGFGGNELTTSTAYNNTDWQHWTCVYDATANKRSLYLNDVLVAEDTPTGAYTGVGPLQLGVELAMPVANYFAGNLDEFRVWNTARDSATIARDFNRILSAGADNLLTTLSFDEGIGLGVYDRSKSGVLFNKRHGQIMGAAAITEPWSMLIPTPDQLGLFGLTDANGSYIISAIPYSGNGQVFKVVPQLGTHQFDPGLTNLFIGASSAIHNNIDFIDISSFPVTGSVFYKGTSCPAEGIALQVDGQTLILNGESVVTNAMGFFTMAVPIGQHRISLFKEGHNFEVGRWPTDGSLHNFQEPISGIEFIDDTKLDIVGRVVGGTKEGNKVPALGRSVNNVGVARVIFESVAGNGCHTDTVFTDLMTGEYSTKLYPLEYTVQDVRVVNAAQNISTADFGVLPLIKLIDIGIQKTAKDTVYTAGSTIIERVDSARYHYQQDFIVRVDAEIEVLNEEETGTFIGEESITVSDTMGNETIINLREILSTYDTVYPIFKSGVEYRAKIKAFEKYENFDSNAPIATDKVPVTDGKLIISNGLAADHQQTINIDLTDGDTMYIFNGGRPNVLMDPINSKYSYTKTMDITLERPGQVADIKWYPNSGSSIDQRVFRGYTLGSKAILGSNFVTQGPEVVDFVLRDPPGSGSTATFSKSTSISTSLKIGIENSLNASTSSQAKVGVAFSAGVGISTDTKASIKSGAGFELEIKQTASGGITQTLSSTSGYTTNENNEAVGHRSDVYVGSAFNVNFGVSKQTELLSSDICNLPNIDCITFHASLPFKIGQRTGFYTAPSNNTTTFAYTHNHIVNYLIPNLTNLRNNLFQSASYTSHIGESDERFGTNNDDSVWSNLATPEESTTKAEDATGASYTWIGDLEEYGIGKDSVRWYNQQISLWKKTIADNEKDKVDAINSSSHKDELISFNGELAVSRSQEATRATETSKNLEIAVTKEFKNNIETEVAGTGVEIENSVKLSIGGSLENSLTSESTTTWEYELADGDQGDNMSVQVYKSPQGWGPIFQIISGQTGCPHEDEVKTAFYQTGTVISNRTLQRDKIEVDIFPKIVQNVPEGEAAVFNVQFQNTSETNDSRGYAVRIDPTSNPDGLSVTMDGETIAVPNEFALAGGSVLTKVISVERGPEKYEYNDIRLLVYVPCQYQAGTSDEVDLVDTATFSVTFLPECTDIRLKEPEDKWVLNNFNNDSVQVTIDNYDINKNGFESVSLQYKPASESRWTELEKWWHPINKADEAGEKIPTDRSFIRHFWNMSSFPDGDYHIRTVSGCELASKETDFMEGHADRINPHPFGTPSPSDGICDPGEDLQIKFNEPIDIGSLTSLNFDIRGVLNGTPLRHEESIAFDGSNDYLEIPEYDLAKRSFAIEFWTKLNTNTDTRTLFSQGSDFANGLFVGLSQGKPQFRLGGKSLTADNALPTNEWKHIVVNYDYEASKASLFVDGIEVKVSSDFTTPYSSAGLINIGRTIADGDKFFNGNIHELRLWSKTRSTIDVIPNMNISLSPTTAGLIGYWPMTEGIGTVANEKVRKRNGVLNGATWTILPVGQAIHFNGTTDYLEATNAGTLILTDEADMTLEMWFKGSTAGTLLSNGLAEAGSNETGWLIGLDTDGKIITQNNGNTFASNTGGYLDDDWHHLSMVLERNSAINLYIDGALMSVGESRSWKGFGAAKLWVGCRGGFVGSVEQRDQFFAGDIDDIRIWNTARRPEQIERDRVHRLAGDELGLVAYYPFEAYKLDAGIPVLTQSLRDTSMNAYHLTVGTGANLNYVQATPPIKLPRPIQKVNFNYSINQDEIILTPTDPSGRLEHVTLDITTRDVKDLYGNRMQSPATWIAFMNKNQVYWDRSNVAFEKVVEEEMTFTATILNTGGSPENFQILNVPAWLTASMTSGTIPPNSSQVVEFTISKGVNIGSYEQDLLLSTDFGFNERLVLNLKVTATLPDWTIDEQLFQHSMSYAGQLSINGIISTDIEDRLAVFVGNELRGVANVELDPGTGKYLVFLDIYSNSTSREDLKFNIWNASEGKVHQPITPTDHTFELHAFRGTPLNPQIFSAVESVQQSYTLNSGWNWVSFPLASAILSDVNETLDGLTPTENDRILSQDHLDIFSDADGWNGTLSLIGNGFNRKEGYKIFLTEPGTFTYNGILGNPVDEPIALTTNWNWIGYIGENLLEINTALASLNPSQGDMIKGQRLFAIYEDGIGWNGSLDFLEPTKGYMINLSTSGTLIYPNNVNFTNPISTHKILATNTAQSRSHLITQANRLKVITEKAGVKVSTYQKNMPMVVTIAECAVLINQEEQLYLAAYKDGVCRGISPIEQEGNQQLAYLMVHGTSKEQLDFRVINESHRPIFDIVEKVAFQNNVLIGNRAEPKVMHVVADCLEKAPLVAQTTGTLQPAIGAVEVYPNPFKEALTLEFQLAKSEHISITLQDVTGRVIAYVYNGQLKAGAQKMTWKESSVGLLSEGIYLLTIQSDSMKHIEKVIK